MHRCKEVTLTRVIGKSNITIRKTVMYIRSILKQILPEKHWLGLKTLLHIQISYENFDQRYIAEWTSEHKKNPWVFGSKKYKSGINLVGYLQAIFGLGEAARSSILALQAAQIPHNTINYEAGLPDHHQIEAFSNHKTEKCFKYNTNLFHINPPELPHLWEGFNRRNLTGRYNIGVWYWELPDFPEDWLNIFGLVDEVWVATQFIRDSISAKSPVPVTIIPPCIHTTYNTGLTRSDFKLPDDRFLFFCAYDISSVQTRKNPLGAIEAFKRAFLKSDTSVGLVIKIINARQNLGEVKLLHEALCGYSNIYFMEDILERSNVIALLNLIDAYVSLHRSEGFGLVPAEAMSLGKPVIMTKWSGNVDFMTDGNSCGVDYKLTSIKEKIGPYLPGQKWAEPDLDHAAFFMMKLRSDQEYCTQISEEAKKFIQEHFSAVGIGQLMKDRMQHIGLLE